MINRFPYLSPVEAPVRAPSRTIPDTTTNPQPERRVAPDRFCPAQKEEVTRTVRRYF
jgi:hypothetical protein